MRDIVCLPDVVLCAAYTTKKRPGEFLSAAVTDLFWRNQGVRNSPIPLWVGIVIIVVVIKKVDDMLRFLR